MSKPGEIAKVYGLGKEFVGGTTEYVLGDEVDAELIKQLCPRSSFWWVKFTGDLDEKGRQILRVRRLL